MMPGPPPVITGWPEFAECFVVRAAHEVEGDILHFFRMLRRKFGERFLEFAFLYNGVNIVVFCNIAHEIPPHARFGAITGIAGITAKQHF